MSIHVAREYVPTLINNRSLLPRLAAELGALQRDCKSAWPYFKQHPFSIAFKFACATLNRTRQQLFTPNVLAAFATVATIVLIVVLFERVVPTTLAEREQNQAQLTTDATFINLSELDKKTEDGSIGRKGKVCVGFQNDKGEGSGEIRRRASGGGSGGNNDPLPPQAGKLPPPSNILAAIPKTPPLHPATLPAAGIDIDPALWKDLKAPVYGDPRSTNQQSSKGPGNGEGIGTNNGLGIGDGNGAGVGPGNDGNMGNGNKQVGCCGRSGANGDNASLEQRILRGNEVEQRARLIFKPEPQYTEEAPTKSDNRHGNAASSVFECWTSRTNSGYAYLTVWVN